MTTPRYLTDARLTLAEAIAVLPAAQAAAEVTRFLLVVAATIEIAADDRPRAPDPDAERRALRRVADACAAARALLESRVKSPAAEPDRGPVFAMVADYEAGFAFQGASPRETLDSRVRDHIAAERQNVGVKIDDTIAAAYWHGHGAAAHPQIAQGIRAAESKRTRAELRSLLGLDPQAGWTDTPAKART